MAYLNPTDLTIFLNLCNGVHDFDEEQLSQLHKAAELVRDVFKSVEVAQDERMRASFKQMDY